MRTLQLLIEVQELTTTNKALRTLWQERDTAILKTVRDLVSSASGRSFLLVCLYLIIENVDISCVVSFYTEVYVLGVSVLYCPKPTRQTIRREHTG